MGDSTKGEDGRTAQSPFNEIHGAKGRGSWISLNAFCVSPRPDRCCVTSSPSHGNVGPPISECVIDRGDFSYLWNKNLTLSLARHQSTEEIYQIKAGSPHHVTSLLLLLMLFADDTQRAPLLCDRLTQRENNSLLQVLKKTSDCGKFKSANPQSTADSSYCDCFLRDT